MNTSALATRSELQNSQINGNADVFKNAAELFNDRGYNTHGLVDADGEPDINMRLNLIDEGIDPDSKQFVGNITSEELFRVFKEVKKKYEKPGRDFKASGHHSGFNNYL